MRDLTPDEKQQFESFTDSDESKPRFAWDDTFQRKILSMLMCDKVMLLQGIDLLKPGYFSNEVHVIICEIIFNYFRSRNEVPSLFIVKQELDEKLKDRDAAVRLHHVAELEALVDFYVPGIDTRDYLLDKVMFFSKVQALKTAFRECVKKMNEAPEDEKTWPYIYDKMRMAMNIERNYEPGLEYFTNIDEMFQRMEEQYQGKERYTSAFESIDNALTGGGLFHGQIGAWIGLPGTGKSLALVKAAVANVLLGYKVLYLTMEMDEVGIAQRFTSMFAKIDINILRNSKDIVKRTIEEFNRDKDDKNQLIIKQFPGGAIDVNGIRSYCSKLEMRGWKPGLIIIDYVGEMKDDPNVKKYESAYRILRDLRGFGVEKGHCTLTCVQPNQSAAKLEISQYIDESNIGTSFDQFKPLDAFWSINQQTQEKDAEIGRGFVIKHRNGKSRFPFKMAFDFSMGTLDIYEITHEAYKERLTRSQIKRSSEIAFDTYSVDGKGKNKGKSNTACADEE
jgi:replicative DNA helicase